MTGHPQMAAEGLVVAQPMAVVVRAVLLLMVAVELDALLPMVVVEHGNPLTRRDL
jgi:hypothetical protein